MISVDLFCASRTNEKNTNPSLAHATVLACHEVEDIAVATVPIGAVHMTVYFSLRETVKTPDNVVVLGHGLLAPFTHWWTVQVLVLTLCAEPLCFNTALLAKLHDVLHLLSSLI